MVTFRFPTKQFRNIPSPIGDGAQIGLFFAHVADVPEDLWDWREVNPREVNRATGVYAAIVKTLQEEPERFHERNRGITVVAEHLSYDQKRQEAIVKVSDNKQHGVVDGAHTLDAILAEQKDPPEGTWPAFVFIKVIVGADGDQIAEIAGGLNTSQQVDLKSLENLREHFSHLQKVIAKEPYADQIAYKMNDPKPVDVREVLYYLAVFDRSIYDDKKHPVSLFGRKEGIVRTFANQAAEVDGAGNSFEILISKTPEILRLRDMIEMKALNVAGVGRFKQKGTARVRSVTNKGTKLHFLNKTVDGKIPLGWIMPMLAGFRSNVEWNKPRGSFTWRVPLEELVDSCIEQLVLGIRDVHEQENSRPEYVGRNSIAWRMSYNTVSQAILQHELSAARRR